MKKSQILTILMALVLMFSLVAVSYTHLSKYNLVADFIITAADTAVFNKDFTLFPVSYTHLDVYKRQAFAVVCKPPNSELFDYR